MNMIDQSPNGVSFIQRGHTLILKAVITGIIVILLSVSSTVAQPLVPVPLPPNELSEPAGVKEMLANPGFEIDANSDKIPDKWKHNNTSATKVDKLRCGALGNSTAHSGTCAFMFQGNPWPVPTLSQIWQKVADPSPIVDGVELTFSVYLSPRTGSGYPEIGRVNISYSDGTTAIMKLSIPSGMWQQKAYVQIKKSKFISLPPGVTVKNVKVTFQYGAAGGMFLIDDASLSINPSRMLIDKHGKTHDHFGWAVALDNNTAVITKWLDEANCAGAKLGDAHVFVHSDGKWTKQAILAATDGETNGYVGKSAAISGDTVVLGATFREVSCATHGLARVFVRSGTAWTEQQSLVITNGIHDRYFADSVAISGDTIVIANEWEPAVYVYIREGIVWTEQQKLTPSDSNLASGFGSSIAIDGNTLVVGAYGGMVGEHWYQGMAFVYVRDGTTWTEQQILTASDGESDDNFGFRVAISGDTALVGSLGDDAYKGSAYVFTRTGTAWTEQQKLVASDGAAYDRFGSAVAIMGDTAVVGAKEQKGGAGYVYTRSGSMWTEGQKLTGSGGMFGASADIDADTILVGVPYDKIGSNIGQGSVWIFELPLTLRER